MSGGHGLMAYTPVRWTVYGMLGLTVMGMSAMSVQLGGAVVGGVAEVAGQLSVLLPEAPERFDKGRQTAGEDPVATTPPKVDGGADGDPKTAG